VIPSSEEQLAFLAKIQRLFSEGAFTATYKYALLIALTDLAVEAGRDDDQALRITHHQLAVKFIELYWQQAVPYGAPGREVGILQQNTGRQASVVSDVAAFRASHPNVTLQSAPKAPAYRDLLGEVSATIAAQPVKYLQNLSGQTIAFLYEREHGAVILKNGVTYCLRRFQPLIQHYARSHWVSHVKNNRRNLPMLGETSDLESFLFESSRQVLARIGLSLRRLDDRCFYCAAPIRDEVDVDHFVPFSLYPRDLLHNFVVAHPVCNRSKSNTLAARLHLEKWMTYVDRRSDDLNAIAGEIGFPIDVSASVMVTQWSYANAVQAGARAWVRANTYEPINQQYLTCFGR
jgi:5-methylcytosine-specific restriction endonuclease McrA